ncbi:MAG: beta-galactosidase trimerization domain-containing protein [Planctomycetota bacterium]
MDRPAGVAIRALRLVLFCFLLPAWPARGEDAYLQYLKTAPEWQRVRQDAALSRRWDTWVYMPWRYRWEPGLTDQAARFCREHGIDGGFVDHARANGFAWVDRHKLKFYNDHTAGKGYLHLRGSKDKRAFTKYQRDPRAVRRDREGLKPLTPGALAELQTLVGERVKRLKGSPWSIAYALDDEISTGAFLMPLPWRVHEDDEAYTRWLKSYYRDDRAPKPQWVGPEHAFAQLGKPLRKIDLSPLLDRMSFNDSEWANFIGALVGSANAADPDTPCGFVGGQGPSMWGGYDYAKLAGKIQWIEAYDDGSVHEILRSLAPDAPRVTTHFHGKAKDAKRDTWAAWYHFAHGNRGMIGWVENWFEKGKPKPWLGEFAATLKELGRVQGPKLAHARWQHDRIAIYYSHPSIQVSWCLDAEAHGKSWVNRYDDHNLGTSHLTRRAWEALLNDAGLQYDFVAYDDVARDGVPEQYKVLILPACYALSDLEAKRIKKFCSSGGTVVADFACGLFDQHGRGRNHGALDRLFGRASDGKESRARFFSSRLWVETDQDKAYGAKKLRTLFESLPTRKKHGYAVADVLGPNARAHGNGHAHYLGLSPQRYLMFLEEGIAVPEHLDPFLAPIRAAGVEPFVRVMRDGKPAIGLEVTRWAVGKRRYLFVVERRFPERGKTHKITLRFREPVVGLTDERTGKLVGDGREFEISFDTGAASMLGWDAPKPAER